MTERRKKQGEECYLFVMLFMLFIYFITVNKYRFCISVIGNINMQIIGIGIGYKNQYPSITTLKVYSCGRTCQFQLRVTSLHINILTPLIFSAQDGWSDAQYEHRKADEDSTYHSESAGRPSGLWGTGYKISQIPKFYVNKTNSINVFYWYNYFTSALPSQQFYTTLHFTDC